MAVISEVSDILRNYFDGVEKVELAIFSRFGFFPDRVNPSSVEVAVGGRKIFSTDEIAQMKADLEEKISHDIVVCELHRVEVSTLKRYINHGEVIKSTNPVIYDLFLQKTHYGSSYRLMSDDRPRKKKSSIFFIRP